MLSHRRLCRLYKDLYKLKLSQSKLNNDQVKELEDCERILDVFNITLARKQAEMEVRNCCIL